MPTKTVIAKNITGSPVDITELGVNILGAAQTTLSDFFRLEEIQEAASLTALITGASVVINDGVNDLTLQQSLNYLTPVLQPEYTAPSWKWPVRVATTASITLSGTQTIDGIAVIAGNRVLVKDQGTGSQNGVYTCLAGAWVRAPDFDETAEATSGIIVVVTEGTASGGKAFRLSTVNPITIGATTLTFTLFPAAGGGSGDVVGPASATDGAVALFDTTTGKLLKNSTLVAGAGDLALGTRTLSGVVDPTTDQQAATKAYVDALAWKLPCRAATTANITLSGVPQTIDGVSVVAGERVLVKNQSTGSQNGIYVANAGAWTRSEDMDTSAQAVSGCAVVVSEGSTQLDQAFVLSTNSPITLGSTSLTFARLGVAGPATSVTNTVPVFADTSGKRLGTTPVTISSGGLIDKVQDPTTVQTAVNRRWYEAGTWKYAVRVATTVNITLSGSQLIDGVSVLFERVLVKNQTVASENGLYDVNAGAWTRTSDMLNDAYAYADLGVCVMVMEGTTQASTLWVLVTPTPITLGTTALAWTLVGGGSTKKRTFGITLSGAGSVLTTGAKGAGITVPYTGVITKWSIFSTVVGSIVVDVWKDTFANFPPTVADTIAGANKPTLSSANKAESAATGWTTAVTAGDVVKFNVDSVSTCEQVTVVIEMTVSV